MTLDFLDDNGENIEEFEDDIVGLRIKKAKEKFDFLGKDDFTAIKIYATDIDTLTNILRELKREFVKRNINKRCVEYILAELGYRTLYKFIKTSKLFEVQLLTKRINQNFGHRIVDIYPKFNMNLGDRTSKNIYIHVSYQQHEQIKEISFDLNISIGDTELLCLICSFNDLENKFNITKSLDLGYRKYCGSDGFLSVIHSSINKLVKEMMEYVIKALPVIKISVMEKESLIASGFKASNTYIDGLQIERKLRDDIEEFLEKLKTC